jgi:hypothetical protein
VQTKSTPTWQAWSPLATAMGLIRSEMLVHSGMPPVPSSYVRLRVIDVAVTFFSRSFGQTEYGKLAAQKTGAVPQNSFNPFAQQQQQQQQQTHNNEQPFFSI